MDNRDYSPSVLAAATCVSAQLNCQKTSLQFALRKPHFYGFWHNKHYSRQVEKSEENDGKKKRN